MSNPAYPNPQHDMYLLGAISGTIDTQGRGSNFTLDAVAPNVDMGGGHGLGEIFGAPAPEADGDVAADAEAGAEAGESDAPEGSSGSADNADGSEGESDAASDGAVAEPSAEATSDDSDVATTEAPAPADAAESDGGAPSAPELPEGWEDLSVSELRELAQSIGLELPPTANKIVIVSRIKSLHA